MASKNSAGVYVTEFDQSIVVPNASTSVACFAGEFTKGTSGEYTTLGNTQELIDTFGYPTNKNYNDWFQVFNYLQYGTTILTSRAVDSNGTFNITTNKITDNTVLNQIEIDTVPTSIQAGSLVRFGTTSEDEYTVESVIAGIDAVRQVDTITINTASDGDYTIDVNGTPVTYTADVSGAGDTVSVIATALGSLIEAVDSSYTNVIDITLGVITVEATTAGVPQVLSVTLGDATITNTVANIESANYILVFEQVDGLDVDFTAVTEAVIGETLYYKDGAYNAFVEAPQDGGTTISANVLYKDRQFIPNSDEYDYLESSIVISGTSKLKFIAKSSGELMNGIEIAIAREADFVSGTQTVFNGVSLNEQFEFAPLEANLEIAIIVRVDGIITGSYIASTSPTAVDYKNKSIYVENIINNYDEYLYCKDNTTITSLPESRLYTSATYDSLGVEVTPAVNNVLYLGNGSDGTVSAGDISTAYGSVADNTIFGAEDLDIDLIISNERARTSAGALATYREDCIAFHGMIYEDAVGLDSNTIVENAVKDVTTGEMNSGNVTNSYNAYYGNYKLQYDKFNDKNRWISVVGDVVGLFAQTAFDYESWYATAGQNRGIIKNAIRMSIKSTNRGMRDTLYKNRINPIASFPGIGNAVIWGQKTLLNNTSSFSRLNVRSLFNAVERSISRYAKAHLFEINDDFERNKFVARVTPFLETVKAKRGIYDFAVVCDTTNNTSQVIDNNEFVGSIFLKPARAIEFIQLNFTAVGSDVKFSELYI